ncbi:VOC family protein [Sporosarcina sp. P12(2017)]|uniref:Glyoxalase n=1 Tax=Sporosarcina ureae TaxID=1571 RepID=A0ABM6JX89_SPOUR|nr:MULTISPECIES: VOC family protein [Sporosarcina]ARF14675.1 glyoxalase [Sporosarcina ureae]PIC55932.1 VOC family protein [Sporosarcina sp. P10]PIC59248.1 VOC family protein [Sporosarcina sp. P12(2017)]
MITKIEHIAIVVKDMEESIAFYSKVFGCKVRLRGENSSREMAFLYVKSHPDTEIELIKDIDTVGQYNQSGIVNHLAFTVEDIDKSIKYFKEHGIIFNSIEPQPTLEGGRMILFNGPNDELLQLVERLKA